MDNRIPYSLVLSLSTTYRRMSDSRSVYMIKHLLCTRDNEKRKLDGLCSKIPWSYLNEVETTFRADSYIPP